VSTVIISVRANPYYRGTKALDGNTYTLTVRWNTHTEKWHMDLVGATNDVEIRGVALVGGKDLLAPYGYRNLGELWMVDNSGADEDPNFTDMGGRFTLEYTPVG